MHRILFSFFIFLCSCFTAGAQLNTDLVVTVTGNNKQPLSHTTVELLETDSSLVKIVICDSLGMVLFNDIPAKPFLLRATRTGYRQSVLLINAATERSFRLSLDRAEQTLQNLTISARKPFIELRPDRTIVNMEAGIANTGTTVLEALEKLPGVTLDKDGNLSLKGRPGVMVMIDGRPTYLNGAELTTLLSGMSAAQISQVELMDNPPAKYDAAGNAGVINIKTKKTNQRGFNGTLNSSFGQGFYAKSNNSLAINYRNGRWNVFANLGTNYNGYFTRIYALRTYFKNDGRTIASFLEQPSFLKGNLLSPSLRTGIDYEISKRTSMSLTLTGLSMDRDGNSNNPAYWMDARRFVDSIVHTRSNNKALWTNGGGSINFRHNFTSTRELTADVDVLHYSIQNDQFFENTSILPGGYSEASTADIPMGIRILSGKADYSEQIKHVRLEAGWKSSNITTDNKSNYKARHGGMWQDDWGRSNHFLYEEDIHAFYGTVQSQWNKWSLQGGLRFEMTRYDAEQLGNIMVKDSSFSRSYNSLFPSAHVSYELDSSNTFTFRASRRIDRPPFQKLNPFLFIINKYTYQRGNPFYRPQYTWNFEVSHLFKNVLLTGVSYSSTTDYFSQIFPIDSNGIVLYTEGNLGRLQNFGLSVGLQLSPTAWWSFSLQTILNHKKMEGTIVQPRFAKITQYNINLNNQFRFGNGWHGEVTGFYNSCSQHDIQEVVDPAGQLSLGISKNILQNKVTIKLGFRDVFYTNWMKGLTQFTNATEYFKLTRDTRVGTIGFTWRFGKVFKTSKRSEGASGDEIQRVGNGG